MGTIAEKLTYLNGTKSAIKDAIEDKGVTVPAGTAFRDFADLIGDIGGGGKFAFGEFDATTSDQTFNVGFAPTRVLIGMGAGMSTYFGVGVNDNGTTIGARYSGSGATASSPVNISLTSDGFKASAATANYAGRHCYYFATGEPIAMLMSMPPQAEE